MSKFKFVVWVIEDVYESRRNIIHYIEQHFRQNKEVEEDEVDFIPFVDIEAACDQFDKRLKPDLVCADLYYRRPKQEKALGPKEVYAEFMGTGRYLNRGRIDLLEQLIKELKRIGGDCPVICTTYTQWFANHPDVAQGDAIVWEGNITSRLKKMGVETILEKQSWDEDKDRLLDVIKEKILLKKKKEEK